MKGVEITIKKSPAGRRKLSPRGPLERRREPEYLPRRLAQRVKFYDLAQFADGSELAYRFGIVLSHSSSSQAITTNTPGLAQYTAQADEIFTADPETWRSTYKQITTAMLRTGFYRFRYSDGTTFLDSNNVSQAHWESDGLKIPSTAGGASIVDFAFEHTYGVIGTMFEPAVRVKGVGSVKWTATRDYSAPDVGYQIRNGDEIYLFPMMLHPLCRFVANAPTSRRDAYYDDWRHWPRAVFNDPLSANYLLPPRASWDSVLGDNIGDGYAGTFRLLNMWRSIASSAQARRTQSSGSSWTHTSISPADVPNPLWAPAAGPIPGTTVEADSSMIAAASTLSGGRLVMAVRQGSNWLYGWK